MEDWQARPRLGLTTLECNGVDAPAVQAATIGVEAG